jgi:curli biogenesis system outer membrane secretion channel CsgG
MKARAASRLLAGIALAWLAASGCTPTVATQARPALAELDAPLRRIAVMPFTASPLLQGEESGTPPRVAAQLVSKYVAEALAARGVEVVAPEDVAATLAQADPSRRAAQVLRERHGADAVVLGDLTRWEEREGEALGTLHAAAVGFRATLQGADGRTLWSAEFDERQQPLSDNVLRAGKYPGGGSRWLSAEELARWGAREIVSALPLGPKQ